MAPPVGKSAPSLLEVCWLLLGLLFFSMAPLAAEERFTLNLKGADIKTLVEMVAAATGKNFVVDPNVKGKVTVISNRPMSADEIYQVFLSILEVHDFIAVPSGDVVKVVPSARLKYSGVPNLATELGPENITDEIMVRVFELNHVNADKLIPALRPLISPKGHMASYGPNNFLVIADYAAVVTRLGQIIQRVDQPSAGAVDVITLRHASAVDLVRALSNLEHAGQGKEGKEGGPAIVADERTNSILLGGDKGERLRLKTIISHLDVPMELRGNTQVVYLRYAKAEELVKVLNSVGENYIKESKKTQGTSKEGIVNVEAYESANAVVITAPAELSQTLQGVIRKLDVRRAQVLVEGIIAEISSSRAAEFGIQWNSLPVGGVGVIGGTNFNGAGQGILSLSSDPLNIGSGLSLGYMRGATNLQGTSSKNLLNIGVLLRALQADGATNVLSTPTLVTLDNEEAEIIVGQNVPFITGSYAQAGVTSTTGLPNPFQTIKRENVGLTLKVRPQINEGDAIRLEIEQEASELDPAARQSAGTQDVVTKTRSIKTVVMVDDGQVLVLGGLIRDELQQGTDKVPLLGDIPILGSLFSYKKDSIGKTNLMVFLRPTILRQGQDNLAATEGKYSFIRERQQSFPVREGVMDLREKPPVLPTFQDYMKRDWSKPAAPGEVMPGPLMVPAPPNAGMTPSHGENDRGTARGAARLGGMGTAATGEKDYVDW